MNEICCSNSRKCNTKKYNQDTEYWKQYNKGEVPENSHIKATLDVFICFKSIIHNIMFYITSGRLKDTS